MHGYKGPDINTGKKGKLGANAGKKGKLGANEARSREAQVGPVSRQGRRDEHFTDNFEVDSKLTRLHANARASYMEKYSQGERENASSDMI